MDERDSEPEVGVGPLHNMGENVENSVRIFQMSNIYPQYGSEYYKCQDIVKHIIVKHMIVS